MNAPAASAARLKRSNNSINSQKRIHRDLSANALFLMPCLHETGSTGSRVSTWDFSIQQPSSCLTLLQHCSRNSPAAITASANSHTGRQDGSRLPSSKPVPNINTARPIALPRQNIAHHAPVTSISSSDRKCDSKAKPICSYFTQALHMVMQEQR